MSNKWAAKRTSMWATKLVARGAHAEVDCDPAHLMPLPPESELHPGRSDTGGLADRLACPVYRRSHGVQGIAYW